MVFDQFLFPLQPLGYFTLVRPLATCSVWCLLFLRNTVLCNLLSTITLMLVFHRLLMNYNGLALSRRYQLKQLINHASANLDPSIIFQDNATYTIFPHVCHTPLEQPARSHHLYYNLNA